MKIISTLGWTAAALTITALAASLYGKNHCPPPEQSNLCIAVRTINSINPLVKISRAPKGPTPAGEGGGF